MEVFKNQTFAVVDLETTGVRREEGDRIIQFGCALVKNLKVTQTFSFMINPKITIPKEVQNLTKISNQDVKDKPTFSTYAPQIVRILRNSIFVAHNVNFDFPFLNSELLANDFPALENPAIDTVELAQIAFPQLPSYKLRDLTSGLHIKHLNPHRADSDAYATAILLIKIIKKLSSLPQVTLYTLSSLGQGLTRNSGNIISQIAKAGRKIKRPLDKDLFQQDHLALRKQHAETSLFTKKEFPQSNSDKQKLFKGKISFRQNQVDLINRLHQFLQQDGLKAMMVEAPNGTGKTFSYLFAYAYALSAERKLVVATPTGILQEQIIKQEIPQLLQVSHLKLKAEIVKSPSHYLDLDGFMRTLHTAENKTTLILQMQILVWLTETSTGDLDELQLTTHNLPIFNLIKHPGDARYGSKFAPYDFWNLARKRQEKANILITNHAYLANHAADTIWGSKPFLVIDEAHRFTENVLSSRHNALEFESFWGTLSHLRNLLFYRENNFASNLGVNIAYTLNKIDPQSQKIIQEINSIQKDLFKQKNQASECNQLPNGKLKFSFQEEKLIPDTQSFLATLKQLEESIELLRQQLNNLLNQLYQQQTALLENDQELVAELEKITDTLDFYSEKCYSLTIVLQNAAQQPMGFILSITNPTDPLSCNLEWLALECSEDLDKIYHHFDHICFISATLAQQGSFSFASQELHLAAYHPSFYISPAQFDLKKRLQVVSVDDALLNPNSSQYLETLKKVICTCCPFFKHSLILFTNLQVIHDLYFLINNDPRLKNYEILAQGQTGSNAKIAKRFSLAKKAIILGANSFWEGIDFHGSKVDLVIASKLPFASPEETRIKLKEEKLKTSGGNVFTEDILPRAIIRFKQGMGRLIRNEKEKGIFLLLDPRVWHQNYGKDFLKEIPVSIKKANLQDLESIIKHVRRNKENY